MILFLFILFALLELAKHFINDSSQPVPPPEGRITGLGEQIDSSDDDDDDIDDIDGYVTVPAT